MTTYRVVVEGGVLQGFGLDDVRRRLAALIGRSDDVAAKLLGGRPSTVKKGIDEVTALRYVESLKKIGVSCHSEQEGTLELDLDADAPQIASARSVDATTRLSPRTPPSPSGVGPDGAASVGKVEPGLKTTRYVDSVIGKGESVLYQARLSLAPFWLWFLVGGLLLLSALGLVGAAVSSKDVPMGFALAELALAALLLLRPIVARLTTELVITNRRVIAKFGIIRRNTLELNLSKIESIRVEQGLLGRLLNYGDIMLIGTGRFQGTDSKNLASTRISQKVRRDTCQ